MLAVWLGDERLAAMTITILDQSASKPHTLSGLTQAEVNKLITWLSQAVMTQSGHLRVTVTK